MKRRFLSDSMSVHFQHLPSYPLGQRAEGHSRIPEAPSAYTCHRLSGALRYLKSASLTGLREGKRTWIFGERRRVGGAP